MIDPAPMLEKKVAVVVGAANGIGPAIALAFAAAGAADSDRTATVLERDEAAWDRVIRVNLTAAFLMVNS